MVKDALLDINTFLQRHSVINWIHLEMVMIICRSLFPQQSIISFINLIKDLIKFQFTFEIFLFFYFFQVVTEYFQLILRLYGDSRDLFIGLVSSVIMKEETNVSHNDQILDTFWR